MKLQLACLGALALMCALPASAEAGRSRSRFDVSIGFGSSSYGRHGGYYDSGTRFGYSRGGYGYDRPRHYDYCDSPRYYRPVVRERYYAPAPRYYRDNYDYYRPVYRERYYYRDRYCD